MNSPKFASRISNFLRHWHKQNTKKLRKPTSTGQKLPEGYTGKREATSYYFYLQTKGINHKNVYHGDETLLPVTSPQRYIIFLGSWFITITVNRIPNPWWGDCCQQTWVSHQEKQFKDLPTSPKHHQRESCCSKNKSVAQFDVLDKRHFLQGSGITLGANNLEVDQINLEKSSRNQCCCLIFLCHSNITEEFCVLYNTKIIILLGGLTPKAQIMDTHNNRFQGLVLQENLQD